MNMDPVCRYDPEVVLRQRVTFQRKRFFKKCHKNHTIQRRVSRNSNYKYTPITDALKDTKEHWEDLLIDWDD